MQTGVSSHASARNFLERVLVVEDNVLIALDTESQLLAAGAGRVDVATNVTQAFDLIKQSRPDFALLDINLGRENCFPIADRLIELEVSFAFATGYGDEVELPAAYREVPRIAKPFASNDILTALPDRQKLYSVRNY